MTRRPVRAALLGLVCGSAASVSLAQTATMPPHASAFSGSTRGYYFTAPAPMRITGVKVLQAVEPGPNAFQNWAIVKFDGATPPPTFSATTNAFVQLGMGLDKPANAFDPASIMVATGDLIGVYGNTMATAGATSGVNSYSATTGSTTTLFGNVVPLQRSGMQFHLGSATSPAGMHDIWGQTTQQITRVEFTYEAPFNPTDPGACCKGDGTCSDGTFADCQTAGGVFQGLSSLCSGVTCPQPVACCKNDGTCTDVPAPTCAQQGGTALGAGTQCASASCRGACCKSDGTCAEQDQVSCLALGAGHTFNGIGSLCTGVTCPAASACCTNAGACSNLVASACTAAGGVSQAAGTNCATFSCNGACCKSDGTCSEMTQAACTALGTGNTFQGFGSLCSGVTCPATVACCTTAGTCSDLVPAACTAAGGLSQGAGSGCATAQCTGACCNADGTCGDNLAQPACTSAGGIYQGGGSACATAQCTGACCNSDGTCGAGVSQQACSAGGGVYQGGGSSCAGITCPAFLATLAPNNGSGGVFMDLTPTGPALNMVAFATYYSSTSGSAVSVQIHTRPGTYVGFSTSSAGWTLHETTGATSAGSAALSVPATLANPIALPAGGTTGVYLHAVTTGGGIRYQGTGTASTSTFSNADLTLFSAHARTGSVPFAGTQNTPRAFSGRVYYEVAGGPACYANCDNSTTVPVLNVADFTCFLTSYASGNPNNVADPANCDGSTTVPVLNVADFTCFLTKYAAGCP